MVELDNPPRRNILAIAADTGPMQALLDELGSHGFVVHSTDPTHAAKVIERRRRFALVVVDARLAAQTAGEGLATTLSHPDLRAAPIVVCGGKEDAMSVSALEALGGDDFVDLTSSLPAAAERLQLLVRRSMRLLETSPLTGLPGNTVIRRRLGERTQGSAHLAVIHVDIDHFKAYNDHYGFLRGDALIGFCVRCLRRAQRATTGETFLGHIGGDDFVVLVSGGGVDDFCSSVIELWDAGVAAFYDAVDRDRGAIMATDRRGNRQRYPIATLSLGVATNVRRQFKSPEEAVAIAAEMKEYAKTQPGSNYRVDRRF